MSSKKFMINKRMLLRILRYNIGNTYIKFDQKIFEKTVNVDKLYLMYKNCNRMKYTSRIAYWFNELPLDKQIDLCKDRYSRPFNYLLNPFQHIYITTCPKLFNINVINLNPLAKKFIS